MERDGILEGFKTQIDLAELGARQRVQMIWINALRECLMEIESKLDKLEQR